MKTNWRQKAITNAEQNGIVFLDEIDKIASRSEIGGADVSRAGVQRDLLPLIEGTTVNTKYGMIKTDHILFIASGAFQLSKPSDLIPELQGRLPIRVELESLSIEDFEQILTSTEASLISQYKALLATEGMQLEFDNEAIRRLAEISHTVNERTENIGARRLYTVMERLLEEISFTAVDYNGTLTIDKAYVNDGWKPCPPTRIFPDTYFKSGQPIKRGASCMKAPHFFYFTQTMTSSGACRVFSAGSFKR